VQTKFDIHVLITNDTFCRYKGGHGMVIWTKVRNI